MRSSSQDSTLARARRYRRISADPVIAARTGFFAAAAVVTRALATRDQPPFFARLGAQLEVINVRRARQIRAGELYRHGSVVANTADFVRFEQSVVQAELERLRECDPQAYEDVVTCASAQIARASRGLARWFNRDFARAVVVTRRQLGRDVDFARRGDRELLGNAIAREAGA
jgi:hypothetical protein